MYLTAGGLRVDYLITREGKAFNGVPGGNALYAAAGAAIWGQDVAPWARYGENFPSKWLASLAEGGLHTEALIPVSGTQDHRTFFAYSPEGVREDSHPELHYARIGQPLPQALQGYIHSTPQQDQADYFEPLAVKPGDWPENLGNVAAVHLAPQPLATHLYVPPILREKGVQLITVDPGERYMIPDRLPSIKSILSQIDVFLPSDMEVRSLFGDEFSLWQAAELFCSWGAKIVAIKIGQQGVLLLDRQNGKRHLLPYHQTEDKRVIDVTGAGDAFCGGFLVGLQQSADPLLATQMGLVSASLTIEGYGALYALSAEKEIVRGRLSQIQDRALVEILN